MNKVFAQRHAWQLPLALVAIGLGCTFCSPNEPAATDEAQMPPTADAWQGELERPAGADTIDHWAAKAHGARGEDVQVFDSATTEEAWQANGEKPDFSDAAFADDEETELYHAFRDADEAIETGSESFNAGLITELTQLKPNHWKITAESPAPHGEMTVILRFLDGRLRILHEPEIQQNLQYYTLNQPDNHRHGTTMFDALAWSGMGFMTGRYAKAGPGVYANPQVWRRTTSWRKRMTEQREKEAQRAAARASSGQSGEMNASHSSRYRTGISTRFRSRRSRR